MSRKNCPYCGEDIAFTAKKCRFCGEWLSEEAQPKDAAQSVPAITDYAESTEIPVAGEMSQPLSTVNHSFPTNAAPQSATGMSNQQPNQGLQQNIVVQPQIVIENKQEVTQNQEQTVIIANSGEGSSSAGGCLWTQLVLISIGLGFVFKGFWYGVAAMILLAIAVFIPFLGPVLCIISGLAFGALAGIIATAFGAATWVGWLIGIVSAAGLVSLNLEQRKEENGE